MKVEFKTGWNQLGNSIRATLHVIHLLTFATFEMVVMGAVRRLETLWPAGQFHTNQITISQSFVKNAIDGCDADFGIPEGFMDFHGT